MLLRPIPLASLLVGLWAIAWLALGTGGCASTGWPVNLLVDSDGDGLPDYVRVGDFDGDGVLELDDVKDAVDALTDPGPKLIQVVPGIFVPPPDERSAADFEAATGFTVTGASCVGTQSGVPCIE